MHAPRDDIPALAGEVWTRMRNARPRVHCITNAVAQNFTANILLAAGAVPSMTIAPAEIGDFVASANALLVNLGTFDAERRAATGIALDEAAEAGIPWVLDPVLIERSAPRAAYAAGLAGRSPRAIRLNAAELNTLAQGAGAQTYARDRLTVLALTGETDLVTDGVRHKQFRNGHFWMAKVTAMGCAQGALIAACLAAEPDPFVATLAAVSAFGIAGEMAATNASGPGTFAAAMLDALSILDGATVALHAKVSG